MIKRTIEYVDYNGTERVEDFYFDLSAAELTEYQWSTDEGMDKKLQQIVNAEKNSDLIKYFKDILLISVGKKSEDGKRFIKNQDIIDEFVQSPAYSILFMELASDANAAAEFVNGIIPEIKELPSVPGNVQ